MIGTTRGARHPLVVAGLFAWVVALYAISLGNDFVYDDYGLIVRRRAPASVAEVAAIFTRPHHAHKHPYYRPLAALTMELQKSLHGDRTAPFHLMNALVAGAVALLSYSLLRRTPFGRWYVIGRFAQTGLCCLFPRSSCEMPTRRCRR